MSGADKFSLALISKAAVFAADKHKHQQRKDIDGSPYINHPLGLLEFLTNIGGISDVNVLCAALLHDTIEDTDTSSDELTEHFGSVICQMVLEVSDDPAWSKQDRKRLQLEKAKNLSHPAQLIKIADKYCNVRDIMTAPPAHWSAMQMADYITWAVQVVDVVRQANQPMAQAFDALFNV